MIGSVPRAAMLMPVVEARRQHMVDHVEEVVVAARPCLDKGDPGGGVRTEHLDDAVAFVGNKSGYLGGDVAGLRVGSGSELEDLSLHFRS